MKHLKESYNPVLEYKRITLEVDHDKDKTPSNQEITSKVAQELKVSPELVKVKHIYSHYGLSKSKVIAHVYKNIEMLKKIEEIRKKPKAKKEKKQQKQEKKE